MENTSENTGFFLWLSNYWLACIFQHANNTTQKTKYFWWHACNERQTIKLFEKCTDSDSVIDKICNIATQKLKCEEIEYDIKFFSCSCPLTKSERQKIVRKHTSTCIYNTKKVTCWQKYREKCKKAGQRATEAKFNPLLHDLDNYISRFHNKIKYVSYYVYMFCFQPIILHEEISHDFICHACVYNLKNINSITRVNVITKYVNNNAG